MTVEEGELKLNSVKARAAAMEGKEEKPEGKEADGVMEKQAGEEKGRNRINSDKRGRRQLARLSDEEKKVQDDEKKEKYLEEQAKKPVLEKGVKGNIKWFSIRNKYGFIERDEKDKNDVFVHQMAISSSTFERSYLRTLKEGEAVVFDVVEGEKGPEASNVTGPDGSKVQGVRFYVMRSMFLNRSRRQRTDRLRPKTSETENGEKNDTKVVKKNTRRHRRHSKSAAENGEKKNIVEGSEKVTGGEKKRKRNGRQDRRRQVKEKDGENKREDAKEKSKSQASGDGETASSGKALLESTV